MAYPIPHTPARRVAICGWGPLMQRPVTVDEFYDKIIAADRRRDQRRAADLALDRFDELMVTCAEDICAHSGHDAQTGILLEAKKHKNKTWCRVLLTTGNHG